MSEARPIGIGFRKPPETPRPGPTTKARVTKVAGDSVSTREDLLATEEPCEIRLQHRGIEHTISVTMRTPGNDFELAVGFLFGEGIIASRDDIREVSYCASGPPEQLYNVVTVRLRDEASFDPARTLRNFTTSSSCGVCGKASLEAVGAHGCEALTATAPVDASVIESLPGALRTRQKVFDATGGLHAAGVFRADGSPVIAREDIGRHNAVDKIVGWMLMNGAHGDVLQVSGRASFEIVQKALMARIPVVSAVSAPSSLAVQLAQEYGLTLIGFARDDGFNIYSAPARIVGQTSSGATTNPSR